MAETILSTEADSGFPYGSKGGYYNRIVIPTNLIGVEESMLPSQGSEWSSGYDIKSRESGWVFPFSRKLFRTGISVAIPSGWEIQIRPRSGLALKKGITVLNTPGTIDSDYRGEIGVILYNSSFKPFKVNVGDRIAQAVLSVVRFAKFMADIGPLDVTTRGAGGFGSTGVNS